MVRAMAERNTDNIKIIFLTSADSSRLSTFSGSLQQSVGSLTLSWAQPMDQDISHYIENIRPVDYPDNQFLHQTWDDLQGCANRAEKQKCYETRMKDLDFYFPVSDVIQSATGIMAFAYAIDALVRDRCPEALSDPSLAKDCVKPVLVNEYLKKVQIPSPKGPISFNEKGEITGEFNINQLQQGSQDNYELVSVGLWKEDSDDIDLQKSFQWYFGQSEEETAIPESVCAKPCNPGEQYIQGELPCCWECYRCRDNEYLANNDSLCVVCPYLTWPDNITFTTCLPIKETYLSWSDIYGIGLTITSGIGVIVTVSIFSHVVRHRQRRVIKGTVMEMVLLILTGIFMAFGCVPLYIFPASDLLCIMSRIFFTVSCTLIYGPLFVKTQLIYSVFAAAENFKRQTKMATPYARFALTIVAFVIQVGS